MAYPNDPRRTSPRNPRDRATPDTRSDAQIIADVRAGRDPYRVPAGVERGRMAPSPTPYGGKARGPSMAEDSIRTENGRTISLADAFPHLVEADQIKRGEIFADDDRNDEERAADAELAAFDDRGVRAPGDTRTAAERAADDRSGRSYTSGDNRSDAERAADERAGR